MRAISLKKKILNTLENLAKFFESLLRVQWGKLTSEPPHMLSDTYFSGRLKFFGQFE